MISGIIFVNEKDEKIYDKYYDDDYYDDEDDIAVWYEDDYVGKFFRAIGSTLTYNKYKCYYDSVSSFPEGYYEIVSDGHLPIYTYSACDMVGKFCLTTPEAIKTFLEVNYFWEYLDKNIKMIYIGWRFMH